jgi:uncharacterized protein YgiM (DUF1202 family)
MKKRVLRLLLTAAIAATMLFFGAIHVFGAEYYATSDVFVRSGPSIDSAVIGGLARADVVDVIERVNDWWYRIRIGNGTGFVSALFVHQPEDVVTTGELRVVNTPFLNVRAGAGVDWLVVGMLLMGEEVYVLETYANGWVRATGYGFTAYVNGRYLR